MIHAWLLDYRPLAQPTASEAAAAAATLPDRLNEAMAEIDGRPEWAVLSTCHRCEVYGHQVSADQVLGVLRGHIPPAARAALTAARDECAVRHLMRVAAGLDSMLLGETDVQRQVAATLARSTEQGSAGPVLNALFGAALHAGKRVRTETDIGRHASSLASAAVDLVASRLEAVDRARAVVFGAGTMARRACERLHAVGIGSLMVINRTFARAERLAETHGGQAVPWDGAADALCEADIAIAATAAPEPFIDAVHAALAPRRRRAGPAAASGRPGAPPERAGGSLRRRQRPMLRLRRPGASHPRQPCGACRGSAARRGGSSIRRWRTSSCGSASTRSRPALRLLGELAAATRDDELERAWRRLPELTARQRRVVQTLAHNIARRLVRRPMLHLREAAGSDRADRYRDALEHLFADPGGGDASPDSSAEKPEGP